MGLIQILKHMTQKDRRQLVILKVLSEKMNYLLVVTIDKKYLEVIMRYHQGGPVGIEAIAATLNEESETLEELVEPYLLKIGLISRTRMGRKVNEGELKNFKLDFGPSSRPQQGDLKI
jgi:Holliday junction DNA helicase RuvB